MSWFKRTVLFTTLAASLVSASSAMADPFHHHGSNQPQVSFSYSSGTFPAPYYGYGGGGFHRPWQHHAHHFMAPQMVVYHTPFPRYYAPNYYFQSALMTPAAYEAFEYAEPGSQVLLNRPGTNGAYSVTPGRVTSANDGRYCREYQAKVMVNNLLQDSYGQACRQPDGSWEIVS